MLDEMLDWFALCLSDRFQISLLMLSEFKQINQILFHPWFSDDFGGNRS